jgi:hypothetical protein
VAAVRAQEQPAWQVHLRAVCALEAVLDKGMAQACGEVAVMFQSDPSPVKTLAQSPQPSVRERAAKVYLLLTGEHAGVAPPPAGAAARKPAYKPHSASAAAASTSLLLGEEAPASGAASGARGGGYAAPVDLLGDLEVPAAAPAPAPAAAAHGMFAGLQQPQAPQQPAYSPPDLLGGLASGPAPDAQAAAAPAAGLVPRGGPLDEMFAGELPPAPTPPCSCRCSCCCCVHRGRGHACPGRWPRSHVPRAPPPPAPPSRAIAGLSTQGQAPPCAAQPGLQPGMQQQPQMPGMQQGMQQGYAQPRPAPPAADLLGDLLGAPAAGGSYLQQQGMQQTGMQQQQQQQLGYIPAGMPGAAPSAAGYGYPAAAGLPYGAAAAQQQQLQQQQQQQQPGGWGQPLQLGGLQHLVPPAAAAAAGAPFPPGMKPPHSWGGRDDVSALMRHVATGGKHDPAFDFVNDSFRQGK